MIALVIGLLVVVIGFKIYLLVKNTYRLQQGVVEVQNSGQFILEYLTNDFQMSGWKNPQTKSNKSLLLSSSSISDASGDNNSDSIIIRYEVSSESTQVAYDCAGRKKLKGEIITNQYTLVNNILRCNNQQILQNVENIQFQYGIDRRSPEFDGSIDAYVSSKDIDNFSTRILSMKIAILLRSKNDVLDKNSSKTFQILDYPFQSTVDRKLRRLFEKTIILPNNFEAAR